MAYSELVKNFELVRDYMRQFYVYGFKSRSEYTAKSARSYDNERRRVESWLQGYMSYRQTEDGKNVFLCVDSRTAACNPLYQAFKAKSFTAGDIMLHFYLLDLLADGSAYRVKELVDGIATRYLSEFDGVDEMDVSSVRKKLKEYEDLGLLQSEKRGRELFYRRSTDRTDLPAWREAVAFFSECSPLGVIGSTILDKYAQVPDSFRFKHHYILDALNAQIIGSLSEAIMENRFVDITVKGKFTRSDPAKARRVFPLKIRISTQSGRQHLICYHYRLGKPMLYRIDNIHNVRIGAPEPNAGQYRGYYDRFAENLWGVSSGVDFSPDHVSLVLHFGRDEQFILERLEREKRIGTVEQLSEHTCRFTADVYDAAELLPWIRTFIGRIVSFTCSDPAVEQRFYADLAELHAMYRGGGTDDAV